MKNILSFIKFGALAFLCGMLLMTSCNKVKPATLQINGEWELQSTTSDPNGEIGIQVYLEFNDAAKTFELYQKLGEGHFRHYDGTYVLTEQVLSGTYSDGKSFASNYNVTVEGDMLTLTSQDGEPVETNVYKRSSIPSDVRQDAMDFEENVKSADSYRAL